MFARAVAVYLLVVAGAGCQKDGGATPPASDPRRSLVGRISTRGDVNAPSTPRPLVSLEEFFRGNDDLGSIGYNFGPNQPRPSEFFDLFRTIRDKANVADVRVQVTQHDDPRAWPVTDTIWIITSASNAEVATWLGKRFAADEILAGFVPGRKYEPVTTPSGMRAVGVWWD